MERRSFLKTTGAFGAGSILGAFNPLSARATAADGSSNRTANFGAPATKPLETESNDLSPYTGTWGDAQIHHLLRRSMFGVPPAQFQAAKALGSMNAVVDKLLEASDISKVPLPQPKPETLSYFNNYMPPPSTMAAGINQQRLDTMRGQQLVNWWFDLMVQENLSIREKMTLFWTNHFVTGYQTVQRTCYMYAYLQMCRQYSLGNFKDFATAISTSNAMLVYLNGNQSEKNGNRSKVNENYARELMELFTLGITNPRTGQPNYTEADVQNAARALSGWKEAGWESNKMLTPAPPYVGVLYDGSNGTPSKHDTDPKTFLGKTGNFGLTDVINIIFEQGTPKGYNPAYFICEELYQNFVYYVPNPTVVDAMATLMVQSNFEVAPVMKALLSSSHFYDVNVIGAQLKSPAEFMGSLVREFGMSYDAFNSNDPTGTDDPNNAGYKIYSDTNPTLSLVTSGIMGYLQGQLLLDPPNVKGWPGGHNWISTGTFQGRENASYAALNNYYVNTKQNVNLSFSADLYANQIQNAAGLSSQALSKALEDASLAFTLGPLESGDLKKEISKTYPDPNYQYNAGDVTLFALYLVSLPEFQLL